MNRPFKFEYLSLAEAAERKNLLHEIKTGVTNGAIIKDFFSSVQLENLLSKYKAVTLPKAQLPLNQGVTFPTVFAHVKAQTANDPKAIADYFDSCTLFKETFGEQFVTDASKMFTDMFTSLAGGRKVGVPKGIANRGNYPFATFRDLNPGTGEMTLHCGLWFYKMFPEFYTHMNTIVGNDNQLSYFSLLQKPKTGGELTIFDVTWEECDNKVSDEQLLTKNGQELTIGENLKSFPLNIEQGDLLIFDGGNIWHRVELVGGDKNRITLGGFIGFTKDENEIFFWS